jgi:hypothetical protein
MVVLLFHIAPVGKTDNELAAAEVGLGNANTCSAECAKNDLWHCKPRLSEQTSTEEGQKAGSPADLVNPDVHDDDVVEEAMRKRKAERNY